MPPRFKRHTPDPAYRLYTIWRNVEASHVVVIEAQRRPGVSKQLRARAASAGLPPTIAHGTPQATRQGGKRPSRRIGCPVKRRHRFVCGLRLKYDGHESTMDKPAVEYLTEPFFGMNLASRCAVCRTSGCAAKSLGQGLILKIWTSSDNWTLSLLSNLHSVVRQNTKTQL